MDINTIPRKLKENHFISEFLTEKAMAQFKKYLLTGILSFGLEYTIFVTIYKIIGLWYITANTITYVIVFWFNFLMNRFWSFESKGNLRRQLYLYSILFVSNLVAITALMFVLSDIFGITPLISKVLVMGAVVSWNFVLYKKVIYR